MSEPSETTSPLALVSLLTGVMGLGLSLVGCMFSPILFVASVLCLIAIVMGAVEIQKVNAGQSAHANKMFAMMGVGTGLGGCGVSLLYFVVVFVFVVLYFVFVALILGLSALGAGGP